MHHMDAYEEKAWRKLQKNAISFIEQILEETSHKTTLVWTPTTHLENYPKHAGHGKRIKDEVMSYVLL